MKKISAIVVMTLAFGVGPAAVSVPCAQAATRTEMRREIRQTPLLERPNRPGHFYGNNVRRVHNLRSG